MLGWRTETWERLLVVGAITALGGLLHTILLEEKGIPRVVRLQAEIEAQVRENEQTKVDNGFLRAQIGDLKRRPETMEAMARYQLNMIRPDEIFVQTPAADREESRDR